MRKLQDVCAELGYKLIWIQMDISHCVGNICFRDLLTIENIGTTVYIGVKVCESLLISYQKRTDLSSIIEQ